jgi:hypothetical protein
MREIVRDSGRLHGGRRPANRLIDALIVLSGSHAELLSHSERPWASATFSGSRHQVTLTFTGLEAVAAAEQFIEAVPEHEFEIPGQLVADAAVIEASLAMLPEPKFTVVLELLLEDA